jgi:hypothetical protein
LFAGASAFRLARRLIFSAQDGGASRIQQGMRHAEQQEKILASPKRLSQNRANVFKDLSLVSLGS